MKSDAITHSPDERGFVRATCLSTLFRNEENFYTVIRVKVLETNEPNVEGEIIFVGMMPDIQLNETITAHGRTTMHQKYGLQYQVTEIHKERPTTGAGLISYLSSDIFKGIGKKTAERIIEVLGDDAIETILADPTILTTKVKLKQKQADVITQALEQSEGINGILLKFAQYGIPATLSTRIFEKYKEMTWEVLKENPYRLVEDIEGVSFQKADEIAVQLGFEKTHAFRIQAALMEILMRQTFQDGHTYTEADDLFSQTTNLLSLHIPDEELIQHIQTCVVLGKMYVEGLRVFLATAYFAEKGISDKIKGKQEEGIGTFSETEIMKAIGEYEDEYQITFSEAQQRAIQMAINKPFSIITGGPGTGKTTVVRGLLYAYCRLHGLDINKVSKDQGIFLSAPTGRASKRLAESTQRGSSTIHKMLGWTREGTFTLGEDQKLEGKLLIVDEFSMVDIFLAYQLFKAIPPNMQVIFVGDEDQLPSVGPGQVLRDLLLTGSIPVVKLDQIYRQSENSTIIDLAYAINRGEVPANLLEKSKDFSFVKCHPTQLADVVVQISNNALQKGYSVKDIQVLAPMYKGPSGIDKLNEELQNLFNPKRPKSKELIVNGDRGFRIGDKVLQLVNQVENNVFNGDVGEVISITFGKDTDSGQDEMMVSFDGNEVLYERADLTQLTHAYCCSIHKSQGSEYPLVILPVTRAYSRMLRRNLLYTAATRAQSFLVICGEVDAFMWGVQNADANERRTTLQERFHVKKKDEEDTTAPAHLTEEYINSPKMAEDELARITQFPLY